MAIEKKCEWEIEHTFDRRSCRHSVNGVTTVLHCHHYATLYSQLADDAQMVDGKALLRQAAEITFWPVLTGYYRDHTITARAERITLAEEYWRICGMGTLTFEKVGPISASARMEHSHVDQGWIIKWGQRDEPVNFIGQGYLAAALAAIYDLPSGSYVANEVESIVSGAEMSRFSLVRR